MKTVNDLNEAQLVALTDEALENLIDIECAERGIPLLPSEPVVPMEPTIDYDVIAYVVGSFEFQNRADAESIAEIINGRPRAKYSYGSGPFYESEFAGWVLEERAAVTEKPILSAAQRLATKAVRLKHQTEKTEYDKLVAEYRKILEQRDEIGAEVRQRHWNALKRQHERDRHRANFEHYLKMADGDRAVAFKFFDNSYHSVLLDFPELRDEFAPPVIEQAADVAAAS